jgi:hypothetical protein
VERQLGSVEGKLDEIATKLDEILSQLKAQSRMTRELLSKAHDLPTYIVLLPKVRGLESKAGSGLSAATSAVRRVIDNPGSIFNDTLVMHFVDPVSLEFADTNGGDGFELTHPKKWVAKAAPYLSMGLAVLSVATAVGRVAGFPVPNVAGTGMMYLDSATQALANIRGEAATAIADALHLDRDALARELEGLASDVTERAEAFVEGVKAAPDSAERLDVRRKAVALGAAELRALLDATHKGWADRCGLVRITSPKDGYTEWVLPEHVDRFKENGIASLGTATKSGEERGAKAEAELKRLQRLSVGSQGTSALPPLVTTSSNRTPGAQTSSSCVVC